VPPRPGMGAIAKVPSPTGKSKMVNADKLIALKFYTTPRSTEYFCYIKAHDRPK